MEKWIQSKPNRIFGKMKPVKSKGCKYHYGMPVNLFGDRDKDRVDNVFDCKPKNARRQDVIRPIAGGNLVQDMYARQEAARREASYKQQLADLQATEDAKLAELQRLSNVQYIDRTQTIREGGQPYIMTSSGTWVTLGSAEGQTTLKKIQQQTTPLSITTTAKTTGGSVRDPITGKTTPISGSLTDLRNKYGLERAKQIIQKQKATTATANKDTVKKLTGLKFDNY